MVRGGRADAPGTHSDVSFRLDQKAANCKAATGSRRNQWSPSTEEKQQNELAQTELCFKKTIKIIRRGNYSQPFASISALHWIKRRQISRWPCLADSCNGVRCLNKKKIDLLHENDENK